MCKKIVKFAFLEEELVHNFGQKFEIDRKKGLAIYFDRKRALFFGFFAKGLVHDFGEKLEVSSL